MRFARVLALVASAAVLVAACSDSPVSPQAGRSPRTATASPPSSNPATSADLRRFYTQRLRWETCGGQFQCAQLTVPMNYAQPADASIKISVVRLPAEHQDQRVGSLVVNPGGPGESGIGYARAARAAITTPVLRRFDIVGFDPRGVGQSSPVDCLTDRELDEFISTDGSPDDGGERREAIRASQSFARGCARRTGDLLGHVATPNVARDLDVLRAALGDERLYYLGKSYGTFIGATYAELFPEHVGRLVLDGAIDPSVSSEEAALTQARGFEQAMTAFVGYCLAREICPLEGSRSQALEQVRRLLERIDRSPLPTRESRRLTESLAILGIAITLYEEQAWPALAVALRLALSGDGSALLQLSDIYTDRRSNGTYDGNTNEAIYAVNCLDGPAAVSSADGEPPLDRYRAAAPTFGEYLAWSNLPCTYWPVPPVGSPHPVAARGAPPILVVGTTRDPATPYAWAQGLAAQLQSGVLLTYVGDGHTAYARGSNCVDSAVEAYLVRGRVPRDGARCA